MQTERLNDIQYQLVVVPTDTQDVKTILFDRDGVTWVTNTVRIAEALGKRNVDIMRNFMNQHKWSYELLRDGCNITPVSYLGGNGESRPMWLVDERAFSAMLTSMTGHIANRYSMLFMDEYYKMRDLLTQEQLDSMDTALVANTKINDLKEAVVDSALDHNNTITLGEFANILDGRYLNMHISVQTIYEDLRDLGLIYLKRNVAKVSARHLLWSTPATNPYDCVRVLTNKTDALLVLLTPHWESKGFNINAINNKYFDLADHSTRVDTDEVVVNDSLVELTKSHHTPSMVDRLALDDIIESFKDDLYVKELYGKHYYYVNHNAISGYVYDDDMRKGCNVSINRVNEFEYVVCVNPNWGDHSRS